MLKEVTFIYPSDDYYPHRESVARNFCRAVSAVLALPDKIEIEFANIGYAIYGETLLDSRFRNRMRINNALDPKELIHALVHELIHINQVYTGRLSANRNGTFMWDRQPYSVDTKTISNGNHAALPWEQDVANKQQQILMQALAVPLDFMG